MGRILALPFELLWNLIGLIFNLIGRTLAVVIGLFCIVVGVVLSLTGVGALAGIPLILIGGALVGRGLVGR